MQIAYYKETVTTIISGVSFEVLKFYTFILKFIKMF